MVSSPKRASGSSYLRSSGNSQRTSTVFTALLGLWSPNLPNTRRNWTHLKKHRLKGTQTSPETARQRACVWLCKHQQSSQASTPARWTHSLAIEAVRLHIGVPLCDIRSEMPRPCAAEAPKQLAVAAPAEETALPFVMEARRLCRPQSPYPDPK